MSLISEAAGAPTQMAAVLDAGVDQLSNNQTVSFQQYTKSTIPTDGYVFWVATGTTQQFKGSLHVLSERKQEEDQTLSANQFVFTAEEEVSQLNAISPGAMWVGTWQVDGAVLQVAFSATGFNYQQAGLWHYRGFAVYPALASQLVSSAASLPPGPIVSNSLPIWMGLSSQSAVYPPFGIAPVYPSFLVPDNIVPPYITAHIDPSQTIALQAFPLYGWPGVAQPVTQPSALGNFVLDQSRLSYTAEPLYSLPSWQLMRDTVRLTMYGFTNQQAIQFFAALMDYSVNSDDFGFCNSPAIVDDKRTQVEIAAIAMKKTVAIQASYYQGTADAIARRLILSASITATTS
jgi:hypothetical protein